MSQRALGETLGLSDVSVGRIEKGKQNWPQDVLVEAAHALGCHWVDLLPTDTSPILQIWARLSQEERDRAVATLIAIFVAKGNPTLLERES